MQSIRHFGILTRGICPRGTDLGLPHAFPLPHSFWGGGSLTRGGDLAGLVLSQQIRGADWGSAAGDGIGVNKNCHFLTIWSALCYGGLCLYTPTLDYVRTFFQPTWTIREGDECFSAMPNVPDAEALIRMALHMDFRLVAEGFAAWASAMNLAGDHRPWFILSTARGQAWLAHVLAQSLRHKCWQPQ